MRISPPLQLIALLVIALGVWAGSASAQEAETRTQQQLDDERARTHYLAGESYFAAERWSDAAREFSLAYDLSHRQEMLINLSRAHERSGELQAAIADLELLLDKYPSSNYRLEADQRIEIMRSKLRAQPAEQPLEAEPEGPAVEEAAPVKREVKAWPPHLTTLIVGGAAIATGITSLATGLRAHGLYKDLDERCPNARCEDEFESDRNTGRALGRASTGLMFTSVALAATTAALWVIDLKRDRQRSLAVGITGNGAQLRGQF